MNSLSKLWLEEASVRTTRRAQYFAVIIQTLEVFSYENDHHVAMRTIKDSSFTAQVIRFILLNLKTKKFIFLRYVFNYLQRNSNDYFSHSLMYYNNLAIIIMFRRKYHQSKFHRFKDWYFK